MFITFEGIEGSGKGTVIALTAEWLQSAGRDILLTREPGGSSIGPGVRSMLLDVKNAHLSATAELFLYLADRAQHVSEVIVPAIQAEKMVICDRYADSTIVYQGYGRGLPIHTLFTLNHIAVGGVWPELTIVLDLPVETGLKRAKKRNNELGIAESEGRFEAESLDFHNKIREGYLDWAGEHPDRIKVVDADGSPKDVFGRVRPVIQEMLLQYE